MKEYFSSVDKNLLDLINGLSERWGFLDQIFLKANEYGVYLFAGFLIFALVRHRRLFFYALCSLILSRLAIVEDIRWFYKRPRPATVQDEVNALISVTNPAFPSGHAVFYFAIASAFYFYDRKLGLIALALAAFLSIARIYLGVHYPSDIVAGAAIGFGASYLLNRLLGRYLV